MFLTGLFSGSFAVLFKLLNCIQRYFLADKKSRIIYFFSAFISSILLTPFCFSKAYRKLLMFFTLALAFECLFKMAFSKHKKKPVNKFEENYMQINDPVTGRVVNRSVTPEER